MNKLRLIVGIICVSTSITFIILGRDVLGIYIFNIVIGVINILIFTVSRCGK